MNNLGRVTNSGSSSESTSSEEEPQWYTEAINQADRVHETATVTYLNQNQLQTEYQEVLQEREALRTENGQLRVTVAAQEVRNTELVETIQAYRDDDAAHEAVRREVQNDRWWNRIKWAGSIALQIIFIGLAIAAIAVILV